MSFLYPKSKELRYLFLILYCSFIFLLSTHEPVFAFQAELYPHDIKPGDAFVIKLKNIKARGTPVVYINKQRLYFSKCGKSCLVSIGSLGLETKPGIYIINISKGKKKKRLSLVVKPAYFPTVSLSLPKDKVFLSPEDLKRVQKEKRRLHFLFQKISERLWDGKFILPLNSELSTRFGIKRILNETKISIHKGIDIKGKTGDKVKASNNGKVVLADELFFGGNTVILDHGNGIFTIYMHLSKFTVKPGDIVFKGDTIGLVGSSGRATGPHLHFGVKINNTPTNPLSLLRLDL